MRDNVARVGLLLCGLLGLVALALGYWQLLRAPQLANAPGNPRPIELAARVQRGRLLDRQGQPLAFTERTPGGLVRHYSLPAASAVTGYHSTRFGSSGLEAVYDRQLSGERSPDPLDRLRGELVRRPQVGSDVELTIDAGLQRVAADALGDARGALVALDPKSGAVLALVSKPWFDPNAVERDWERLTADPAQPLFNRALQATYTPGSTFKTVVAAAAVDLGLVDLERKYSCTRPITVGELAPDCRNHAHLASINFYEAYAWSCNRTFALTALGLGGQGPLDLSDQARRPYPWEQQGIDPSLARLRDYARRFGFEQPIPFDLAVEPSRLSDPDQRFFPSLLAQTGFGQGQLAATPLQMALVAATIANSGLVPRPYLASESRSPSGATSLLNQPGGWLGRAVASESANQVRRMMELGVEVGYAQRARIPGVRVAGKTGTAEVGDGRQPHAWFIGFAPADNPRVAVAVIMEHRGSGAEVATPVGQRVMASALALSEAGR